MSETSKAYGPPEAGLAAVMRKAQTTPTGGGVDLRELVAPLYDPALGLDASICKRAVIDVIRHQSTETFDMMQAHYLSDLAAQLENEWANAR